ncbi:hypothetical protein FGG08_005144 [Glutinoglossum americanum]|uniref:Uncharacterized protein n=1 Tax=Glutinoglossum americanum TaxID=1670608 RepID=A0A9P8KYU4_9PEZI|nr:hypothetical protein FGG08_005144 [Glutinoglossum americanum]
MTKLAENIENSGERIDYWRRPAKKPVAKMKEIEEEEQRMLGGGEHKHEGRVGWRSLFNFTTKRHHVALFLAAALSILSGVVTPVLAILLGRIFDDFTRFGANQLNRHELISSVTTGCLGLAGLGSVSWLLNGSFYLLWLVFGELQAKTIRDKLFEGLLNRDIEWYDKRKDGVGALIPRCQTQIRELQSATSQPFGFVIQCMTSALVALSVAFYFSWSLTLVILVAVPFTAVLLAFVSSKMQPSIDSQKENLAEASRTVNGAVSSIETVKAFNGQQFEIWLFSSAISEAAKYYLIQARSNALQISLVTLVTLSMFVQGFWYGSTLLGPGGITAGQIMTTFWSCMTATQSFEQILPHMIVIEKGKAAGAALKAVMFKMERGRKVTDMRGCQVPKTCVGDVDVRNVSFAYPTRPNQWALDHASFFFPAGETTFVIGRSGSGKSTLGNLLLRYYEPNSGGVFIDDYPIQTLDLSWVRNVITLVQQQSVLFNETIFRNIALGRRDHENITMGDVKMASQFALLQETISDMPNGVDTLVGSGGSAMSGGQRQRIAIARARLRDTPILILDESTSALDQISRSLVMDAIREWRCGKTTIVITHDVSQVLDGDFLYVLDEGKVVQEGYRKALEGDPGGLFCSFVKAGADPMDLGQNSSQKDHRFSRTVQRSYSADLGFPYLRKFEMSQDSLDTRYSNSSQHIPSVFVSPTVSFQGAKEFSQLPLQPPVMPLDPPRGMESIELTGRATAANCSGLEKPERRRPSSAISRAGSMPSTPSSIASSGVTSWKEKRVFTRGSTTSNKPLVPLKKIFATLWPALNWRMRITLILGFFSALAHASATPIFGFCFAKLLSTFYLETGRSKEAMKWSLAVLAIAISDATASYFMHYLLEACGQAWIDALRIEAMKRILDQPRSWFDQDKNSLSLLAESLDRNSEEMRNLIGRFAGFAFVAAAMMSIGIIWSVAVCWKLTIVGLTAAPFMYGITRGFEFVSGNWERRSNDASEAACSIFAETFSNIRTVRALTLEGYFRGKYAKATNYAFKVGLKRASYSGAFFGLTDSGIQFVTALIFYYGALLAASGEFDVGDILMGFSLLIFSMSNANQVISFIPQISSSRDSAVRLLRLANLPLNSHERYGQKRTPITGTLTFRNVCFSYPSRLPYPVLRNLNLTIQLGTCTAIVGASGSGKSTLTSLLLRLYDPTSGTITTDDNSNTPFTHLHTPTLRSQIAIVAQTPTLFNASVFANIAYGLPEGTYTASDIISAAKLAGIHDFISTLSDTYNTPLGDNGAALSGGQAQRIAIARALARKPKVLVLDEATSSLDAHSAEIVREAVRRVVGEGVTVVVVTHDRVMMRVAERIYVMKAGTVVEEGSWDELVAARGEFTRVVGGV